MPTRRPTSADVAAMAGVSRTTVSFVLNERADVRIPVATRRRVLDAARALGYEPHGPARQLAGGASQTIGYVLLQTSDQVAADPLLPETLRGLSGAARSEGYRVLIEPIANGEAYDSLLYGGHVDGLVISGPRADDPWLARLVRDELPVVVQGNRPDVPLPSVDVDNRAGARLAVEHLLDLGCGRIGFISNAPLTYVAAQERLAGYREALDAARIGADHRLVVEGAFDAPSGNRAMHRLLEACGRHGGVDAVFVASDVVALGAIAAVREAGLSIPGDISIVGFDDIPLAPYVDPPLTTVRLPAQAIGLAAGRAILDRIAGRPVPHRTLLPTELVVRASTARAGPVVGAAAR